MGSHLGAIGLGSEGSALPEQIRRLLDQADLLGASDDERLRVYRHADASGAAVTVTIDDGAITCLTPGLAPGGAIAGSCGVLFENDCPHERPLGIEAGFGGTEIPLAVVIDDLAISGDAFSPGDAIRLEVVALAEQVSVFGSEAEYRASGTPMAVESMIPSGMFNPSGADSAEHRVSPRILMSGIVMAAERREHALFGQPFMVATVRSLGVDWCVGLDPQDLGGAGAVAPPVGAIVSGQFWLSGHRAV